MLSRVRSYVSQFDRNLWILAVGWFVGAMGFAASIPFLSIYFHAELHMSTTEIGLFFGAMAVVRSAFQAVGGELSDRVERSLLLVHTQVWRAVTFVLLALAISLDWGFWAIAVLVTVNSICGAIFMPAVNALVSDIVPKEKRLDGYAVSRAAGNFGWAAGPAMGGFLAHSSYATLFHISAVITLASAVVFWRFFKPPARLGQQEAFKLADLVAVRKDSNLAKHCLLSLTLYLVVAQLVAPFSVYSVEMVGISEAGLGFLFSINGLMVTLLQVPTTRLCGHWKYTTQLAVGSLLYFCGYGLMGFFSAYGALAVLLVVVTTGEMIMSPASITLTSRLAPEGKMGRYMGVHGFFVTAGWSFGPLYGGFFLDKFGSQPQIAWLLIASLAVLAAVGFLRFGRTLPGEFNGRGESDRRPI